MSCLLNTALVCPYHKFFTSFSVLNIVWVWTNIQIPAAALRIARYIKGSISKTRAIQLIFHNLLLIIIWQPLKICSTKIHINKRLVQHCWVLCHFIYPEPQFTAESSILNIVLHAYRLTRQLFEVLCTSSNLIKIKTLYRSLPDYPLGSFLCDLHESHSNFFCLFVVLHSKWLLATFKFSNCTKHVLQNMVKTYQIKTVYVRYSQLLNWMRIRWKIVQQYNFEKSLIIIILPIRCKNSYRIYLRNKMPSNNNTRYSLWDNPRTSYTKKEK